MGQANPLSILRLVVWILLLLRAPLRKDQQNQAVVDRAKLPVTLTVRQVHSAKMSQITFDWSMTRRSLKSPAQALHFSRHEP